MSVANSSERARTVAVITTSFPRDADDPSGHFVASACAELQEQFEHVHVLAAGGGGSYRERRDGLQIHWLGCGQLFDWPGAQIRLKQRPWRGLPAVVTHAHRLRRKLETIDCEALVAHWLVPSAWPLLAGKRLHQAHAHGADVRLLLAMPGRLRERVVHGLVDRCQQLVFASHDGLDALRQATPGCARALHKVSIVQTPPIQLPARRPTEALRRLFGYSGPTAVLVGRLIDSKRPHLAVAAAAEARIPLTVVGSGPLFAPLAACQGSHRMLGQLPRSACLDRIAAADVLIHTSAAEAAPTVVREARRLGVPVVACASGDLARWAEADPGLFVVPPEIPLLAQALRQAIGNAC